MGALEAWHGCVKREKGKKKEREKGYAMTRVQLSGGHCDVIGTSPFPVVLALLCDMPRNKKRQQYTDPGCLATGNSDQCGATCETVVSFAKVLPFFSFSL